MHKKKKQTTIYVCHGWAYSIANWRILIDLLAKENIQIVMLKMPGLTIPSQKSFTIDDYVKWLHNKLQDIDKPLVLGHSNGGRIALNYCFKYPKTIKHLILVNPVGIPPAGIQKIKIRFIRILAKIFKPLAKITLIRRIGYRVLGVSDYDRASTNMKLTLSNMLNSDKTLISKLTKINTPISFIWGQVDKVAPIKNLKVFKNHLPKIKHEIIMPDTGHIPYASNPKDLAKHIVKIIKSIK